MQPARIAELLEPYLGPLDAQHLPPSAYDHISTYIDLLQRWNTRINLTAIRNEEEIVTRHFGESLFAASRLFPKTIESPSQVGGVIETDAPVIATPAAEQRIDADVGASPPAAQSGDNADVVAIPAAEQPKNSDVVAGPAAERRKNAAHGASRGSNPQQESAPEGRKRPTLADVGSGPGFPGIPIKLWAPEIDLTLIESNQKKATFLKEVARALRLTNINIQIARAQSLPPASFDTVTLRAVERFETILPVAANLVAHGGRLALLVGKAQLPTASTILSTWKWQVTHLIPNSESRILAIGTPESDQ